MSSGNHLAGFVTRFPLSPLSPSFPLNSDVVEAKRRGIVVTNTPDVLTDDVADLALGLMLSTARQLCVADRYVRSGDWIRKGMMPLTIKASRCEGGILFSNHAVLRRDVAARDSTDTIYLIRAHVRIRDAQVPG